MAAIDFQRAKDVLERHTAELGADADANAYIASLEKIFNVNRVREATDFREATKMAVDASKTLFQIAIAVFVALLGFAQFALRSGQALTSWPVQLLGLAALFTFLSMCLGFYATGRAFKRAEGREPADEPWSTKPIRKQLLGQSLLGVLALLAFAGSTALWNAPSDSGALLITLPEGSTRQATREAPLILKGRWSQLELRQEGEFALSLGNVPPDQTRSLAIQVR